MCIWLCSLLYLLHPGTAYSTLPESPKILVFNSYHKGYLWSDAELNGIEGALLHAFPQADIRVEFMDTKRNTSEKYLDRLTSFFWEKYILKRFDLVIASDDSAINFMMESGRFIFPQTPIVFCGANAVDRSQLAKQKEITGVMEYADLQKTLDLALQLQPEAKKLIVINDNSISGKYIDAELSKLIPLYRSTLDVEIMPNLPIEKITHKLSQLSSDTIVLLLLYSQDDAGRHYELDQAAELISQASAVPVYSVWDFYFNHGITGGVLTSGFLQGEAAANIAVSILRGAHMEDHPIILNGGNTVMFDFRQLARFNLPIDRLPREATISNISYGEKKNILLLHSYSASNPWSRSISEGIEEQFAQANLDYTLHIEFMDTKRYTDKGYLNLLARLFKVKYGSMDLDMIIVSDDNAYNFILAQHKLLFNSPPVVFCGVNYLDEPQAALNKNITGVVESYDVLGTLQLGLTLFPETTRIFVINDDSVSGIANSQKAQAIIEQLPLHLYIEHSGTLSMQELQQKLKTLDNNTLVLLGAFTTDKNNKRFTFDESAELITESSTRPVLSFWDFYLNHGILGGAITSGREQGKAAAALAISKLTGKNSADQEFTEQQLIIPTIDYAISTKFGVQLQTLPSNTRIINRQLSFFNQYRTAFYTILVLIGFLLLLSIVLSTKVIIQKRKHRTLSDKAETDPLTGTKNRAFLTRALKGQMVTAKENNTQFILCYLDIDNLKVVNDTLGHNAGDEYIMHTVASIRKHVRSYDTICRIGGDEFVIILPSYTSDKAQHLCRQVNRELRLLYANSVLDIGTSCGISIYDPKAPVSANELLAEADKMMYQTKEKKKMQQTNTKRQVSAHYDNL